MGTGWVCFCESFVSSLMEAKEKEQALLQVHGSRSWRAEDASFWVCLVSWDLMPSTSGFSALPETPSSLSLCCWSWNNVVVNSNSQIKEMYIFKKRDEIIFERV